MSDDNSMERLIREMQRLMPNTPPQDVRMCMEVATAAYHDVIDALFRKADLMDNSGHGLVVLLMASRMVENAMANLQTKLGIATVAMSAGIPLADLIKEGKL